MPTTSLEASPTATYDLDALTAAFDIPDTIAALPRQMSYEKWLARNRLPISWLSSGTVHKGRSCTETERSSAGTLCICTGIRHSEALENTVLYLRARAQRAHGAQQNARRLVEMFREPGFTWSQIGGELDHFVINVGWGRRYFRTHEEERELARTSFRIPRVYHRIDAAFDVAATWYDHLVSTRAVEPLTGPDPTTYLVATHHTDDDQHFTAGRRFLLAATEVVTTGEHVAIRRVTGRDTARVLCGTYDDGIDSWMMCPEPAGLTRAQTELVARPLAQVLGPANRTSLAEHVHALEAAFL